MSRRTGYGAAMSLWTRISEALSALANGEGLAAVFDKLRQNPERTVAFTIAVIALGAKMAKADGRVTRDEVAAFREVFHIPKQAEHQAARVFDLARQDIAGFEDYATRIGAMFRSDDGPSGGPLRDLMEGLFHIAVADGSYHPGEDAYLVRVAQIFGFSTLDFARLRAQFVADAERDPYDVLGVPHDAPLDEVRAAWRALVRETHPDRMMARGVPEEAVKLAEKRLISVNRAWEAINEARA
jgi:DnaJ like chaperone protein